MTRRQQRKRQQRNRRIMWMIQDTLGVIALFALPVAAFYIITGLGA